MISLVQLMLKPLPHGMSAAFNVTFVQVLQGLPGYGGSENGIGIGLGLQHLAQARAQAQFSAQQCALQSGAMTGNARSLQAGYPTGNSSGSEQDISRTGMFASCHAPQPFLRTKAM